MENKTMQWKQKARKWENQDLPEVDLLLTVVHKDNQAAFIKENNLTPTPEELKLAADEKTDFITLSKEGELKFVMLSPPSDSDSRTLFVVNNDPEVSRAVGSLLVQLYC